MDYKSIRAIRVLLSLKYREQRTIQSPNLYACLETSITDSYVNLFGSTSEVIDCTEYGKELKKIKIVAGKKCQVITNIPMVEMLDIHAMPKLHKIEGFAKQSELRDLSISKVSNFKDYDDISCLEKLLFLNLEDNKTLDSLDFLIRNRSLLFLDICRCPNLDIVKAIEVLQKIKSLKHINVNLKKRDLPLFLEALPHVYVNSQKFSK